MHALLLRTTGGLPARRRAARNAGAILVALLAAVVPREAATAAAASASAPADAPGYDRLLALYEEFRAFAPPRVVDGVPDYSAAAMAEQHRALQSYFDRLAAIDDGGWPVARRVDYMLVLAELRGLDFQHRVMRPWARDPAFYSTTDLGFGPKMHGALAMPVLPLKGDALREFRSRLRAVPAILEQARANLTDPRGDLARLGMIQKRVERNVYDRLATDLAEHHPALVRDAERARDAAQAFHDWLKSIEGSLPAHGGVGRENYDWYLRHVLLFPYTWEEMRIIGEREYQRAMTFLKLEEHRHRAQPMIAPATTLAEFERRREDADTDLTRFLRDQDVMTIPDWLVPRKNEGPYVLPGDRDPAKPGPFDAPIKRHFFRETEDRDPRPLRAHNVPGHLFDELQRARDERPIRRDRRLYFIDGTRAEGWAMYLEEMIQQLGFLDDRPKAREINYVLQAKRAARVLPELKLQANEWTFAEALASLTTRTPYWMRPDDSIAMFDLELYLRQPGYGIGYHIGKVQLEALLAERGAVLGRDFDLKQFHDQFRASGMIPISLIRWEMTGDGREVLEMRGDVRAAHRVAVAR